MTKVYTHQQARNIEAVANSAQHFINDFKPYFNGIGAEHIFNTDQSGFNLEFLSGRTLETVGTRAVESIVQSRYSLTHSYTIMPLVSASGKLISPLFIILQEPGGEFGPQVKKKMFKHNSIYPVASKSGKLTKIILKQWFLNIYFPKAGNDSVLLTDSLTMYKKRENIDEDKPDNTNYVLEMMPASTSSIAQPLDVYFFRIYKSFTRRICDFINFNHPEIKLYTRDAILKLQVIVHNQFSSPRFEKFIKYAWFKSGYTSVKIAHVSPNEFCFANDPAECSLCDEISFIRCSWCGYLFCFKHFFLSEEEYHYCGMYIA